MDSFLRSSPKAPILGRSQFPISHRRKTLWMGKPPFRICGTKYSTPSSISPCIKRIIEFCEKQKFGNLYTTRDMLLAIGTTRSNFSGYISHPALDDYRVMRPIKNEMGKGFLTYVWGSKKTIQATKKWDRKNGKANA